MRRSHAAKVSHLVRLMLSLKVTHVRDVGGRVGKVTVILASLRLERLDEGASSALILLEHLLLIEMATRGAVGKIDSWGVGDWPLSLEECNNVIMTFLHGDLDRRLVKVVKQCGVSKAVDEVLYTTIGTFTTSKEESCLALWEKRRGGGRERKMGKEMEESVLSLVEVSMNYMQDITTFMQGI